MRAALLTPAIALAAVATVFPGFLTGALALRLSAALDVSQTRVGSLMAIYFGAATLASAALGRLGQKLGARRQMSLALVVSMGVQLSIAFLVESFATMACLMAVAGLTNAANQSSVNLALTQAKLRHLGRAMAVKQSSMPLASLLAGAAVPAVALTVGWRSAYVIGAVIAGTGLLLVRWLVAPKASPVTRSEPAAVLTSRRRDLILAGVAGLLFAFMAGSINAWTVASGVATGMSEGHAGWLLSGGAAAGIAMRLFWGQFLDALPERGGRGPFWVAGACTVVGAFGCVLLAFFRVPAVHVVGTVLAFGGGWVWPVFTNFGIVRRNRDAASTATGISQTGVYLGMALGPVTTGLIVATQGHTLMWGVVAAVATLGACLSMWLSPRF